MRFPDFLRTSMLLFAAAATALGAATVAGAAGRGDHAVVFFGLGWWAVAALIGIWIGRGRTPSEGVARLLASARPARALPEVQPGRILFNRLWSLALITVTGIGVAFLVPQVPAVAAGYALVVALGWRNQSRAVDAIEGRDGVRYYVEPTSPLRGMQLVRVPGFRRFEVVEERLEMRAGNP